MASECSTHGFASTDFFRILLARLYGATIYQTIGLHEAQSASETLARRAVALDGADAEARSCLSCALRARGELDGALDEIDEPWQ